MKKTTAKKTASPVYHFTEEEGFVIRRYNQTKPFSNFFPGIAGLWGIPMWVFYVNRGQCISSFGIESKDKAILEFLPANKAYRLTSLQGFRTFLKITTGSKTDVWEPFRDGTGLGPLSHETMKVRAHDLTIEDAHPRLGLRVIVNYFTVASESYPALVRRVSFENVSGKNMRIECVDGLPLIMPYGMRDWALKNMSRTVEAWVRVNNLKQKAPYYHLNVEVADSPQVQHITEGFFYFSFVEGSPKPALLEPIVEPAAVFGQNTDYVCPQEFYSQNAFKIPAVQHTSNRTPSAMSHGVISLPAGRTKTVSALIGYASSEKHLARIVRQATGAGFIEKKAAENKAVVDEVKNYVWTSSSSADLDQYAGQTFLDNVMRGGLPVSLPTTEGHEVFNVYSRKHGDMERDYNYFVLAPSCFSQGNGNYRDVNQNRRSDVWFNRDVKDTHILTFLNLIQADGYNPLVVKGLSFTIEKPDKIKDVLKKCLKNFSQDAQKLQAFFEESFQPGQLLKMVADNEIKLNVSPAAFLGEILSWCHKNELADHGEGFWSDHWTYNLDLIESYLAVYPETLRSLLWDKKAFSFFLNTHYVLPRGQRFLLTPQGVRQYHAVFNDTKNVDVSAKGHKLRVQDGEGDVYYTNLFAKLLCLIANKAASFDPSGIGIEMEADKPNWYDALNGLPGLMGSSVSEALELKRLCLFLLKFLDQLLLGEGETLWVFAELGTFIQELQVLLTEEDDPLQLWHRSNDIKEHYRSRVRKGIVGGEHEFTIGQIRVFLTAVISRVDRGVACATPGKGLLPTYFYHEVTDYALLEKKQQDWHHVMPVNFRRHALPLFLEGFVHLLRVEPDPDNARKLYRKLRTSPLYDKKLKMYKVNADLSGETEEIGRTRIFPAGWLENESIWLHMEYKYCLELLRNGLYEEFYETFRDVLIPFQNPERYGRSHLENSSFLVSSAHPDASMHGQGFVARLSGSTAEFVQMWLWMCAGLRPFFVDDNRALNLELKPVLPAWLFNPKPVTRLYGPGKGQPVTLPPHVFAFNFLGHTLTVYHNPKMKDTFGADPAVIRDITLQYDNRKGFVEVDGPVIPAPYAEDVRDQKIRRIDIFFE